MRKAVFRGSTVAVLSVAALTGIGAGSAHAEPIPDVQLISDSTAWTVSTTATSATFTFEPPSMNYCTTVLYKSTAANAQAALDWWEQNPDATPEEQQAKAEELNIEVVNPYVFVDGKVEYRYPMVAHADDLKTDPDFHWDQ